MPLSSSQRKQCEFAGRKGSSMPGYRTIRIFTCLLAVLSPMAQASTITYDFSGTLSQPIDGSNQFNGTLTTASSVAIGGGAQYSVDLSAPNQITLNFAHHSATIDTGSIDHNI